MTILSGTPSGSITTMEMWELQNNYYQIKNNGYQYKMLDKTT